MSENGNFLCINMTAICYCTCTILRTNFCFGRLLGNCPIAISVTVSGNLIACICTAARASICCITAFCTCRCSYFRCVAVTCSSNFLCFKVIASGAIASFFTLFGTSRSSCFCPFTHIVTELSNLALTGLPCCEVFNLVFAVLVREVLFAFAVVVILPTFSGASSSLSVNLNACVCMFRLRGSRGGVYINRNILHLACSTITGESWILRIIFDNISRLVSLRYYRCYALFIDFDLPITVSGRIDIFLCSNVVSTIACCVDVTGAYAEGKCAIIIFGTCNEGDYLNTVSNCKSVICGVLCNCNLISIGSGIGTHCKVVLSCNNNNLTSGLKLINVSNKNPSFFFIFRLAGLVVRIGCITAFSVTFAVYVVMLESGAFICVNVRMITNRASVCCIAIYSTLRSCINGIISTIFGLFVTCIVSANARMCAVLIRCPSAVVVSKCCAFCCAAGAASFGKLACCVVPGVSCCSCFGTTGSVTSSIAIVCP